MKKLPLLLLLLTACASVEPEIIYVEITATPEPTPEVQFAAPEYYFNSWEASGADGMYFTLPNDDCLVFAVGEAAALHEVGHCADAKRSYPSQSAQFEQAIIEYLAGCVENPCWRINYWYEQGQLDEIFAELYVWGILREIPHEFEEFYVR